MSPRGKVQNEQMRQEATEKILSSALRVFSEFGYHGTTMKRISDSTGLSYGLLYHYFNTKEEIFICLVEEALAQTSVIFDEALTGDGQGWQRLEFLAKSLFEKSLKGEAVLYFHIVLQALTQAKHMPQLKAQLDWNSQEIFSKMIPVIIEGQIEGKVVDGNPLALITTFLSTIQGLALYTFQEGLVPDFMTHENLLDILRKS